MIVALTENIIKLTPTEQARLFRLLTDNVDILLKVMPDAPLLKYIKSGYTDSDEAIFQAYDGWKNNN